MEFLDVIQSTAAGKAQLDAFDNMQSRDLEIETLVYERNKAMGKLEEQDQRIQSMAGANAILEAELAEAQQDIYLLERSVVLLLTNREFVDAVLASDNPNDWLSECRALAKSMLAEYDQAHGIEARMEGGKL